MKGSYVPYNMMGHALTKKLHPVSKSNISKSKKRTICKIDISADKFNGAHQVE